MGIGEILLYTYLYISIVNVFIILAMIFVERKNPQSIILWAMTMIILPVISWVMYIMFGKGPRISRKRWTKQKKTADALFAAKVKGGFFEEYDSKDESDQNQKLMKMISQISDSFCTQYNDIELFTDANSMYTRQLEDIRNATQSVHIIYYLFKKDPIGNRFRDLLTLKAQQGVKVKLSYDDSANKHTSRRYFKELIKAGGEVRPFFPSLIKGLNINFNFRNHRKIVVIDGLIGYVGGMNIGIDYMGLDSRIRPWRDTTIRIVGEAVSFLQKRFMQDFANSGSRVKGITIKSIPQFLETSDFYFPTPVKTSICPMQIISSGPDQASEPIKYTYEKMIMEAQHAILIQTPYFIPDDSFIETLILAQLSGVQVHLMIPGVYDKKTVYLVTKSFLAQVLEAGVKVYLYDGFIHAKMLVMDEQCASIGTANMDVRSFALNFEINAVIYERNFVNKCIDAFKVDLEHAVELTNDEFKKRSGLTKIAESFLRMFSSLM